jgi:hypothetical protein
VYALVSGGYSYMVLFFFLRFSYNVTSKLLAEFALLPVGYLTFVMFKGRLRSLRAVIAQMWTHNFGEGFHIRPVTAAGVVALLVLIFAPLWKDRESAYFIVESAQPLTLHAAVAGRVDAVLVHEGQKVNAGQPLLRLSSVDASAMRSNAEAQTVAARFPAFESELRGQSTGSAAAEQEAAARSNSLADEAESALLVRAPADSVVLSEDPASLLHQMVGSGQLLLTLAGTGNAAGNRVVRVFIPASELDRIPASAEVALAPPGSFSILRMHLATIDGQAVTLPAGLLAREDYHGVELPTFFSARMALPSRFDSIPIGTGGNAQIFSARRSLFSRFVMIVSNLIRAHVW